MSRDAESGRLHRNAAVPGDARAADALGEVIDAQLADLVDYCRALTGKETDAVSTAHSAMDSAHALLTDPELLRAWLFALARRKAQAARPGRTQADSPQPREILDLVHRHGIRPQDLPVVLGISAIEAEERLAAAEAEYERRAAKRVDGDSGWHGGTGSGDRAEQEDPGERDDPDERDDGRRLEDLDGLMRTPPDSAGRHAARRFGGGDGWRTLASGRAQLAAATAIVVAVIGVGAAYLAESAHGAGSPGPTGLQSSHHPSPASQTPASTPSPTPTASPKQSAAPTKPVTVVKPPPAPTSTKPKPTPTPTHSTTPSSHSASASASSSGTTPAG